MPVDGGGTLPPPLAGYERPVAGGTGRISGIAAGRRGEQEMSIRIGDCKTCGMFGVEVHTACGCCEECCECDYPEEWYEEDDDE